VSKVGAQWQRLASTRIVVFDCHCAAIRIKVFRLCIPWSRCRVWYIGHIDETIGLLIVYSVLLQLSTLETNEIEERASAVYQTLGIYRTDEDWPEGFCDALRPTTIMLLRHL
jgi:hypothetical protein